MKKLLLVLALPLLLGTACEKKITSEPLSPTTNPPINSELLQGYWVADDDPKTTIGFEENTKIDYYENKEMGRGEFTVNNEYLSAQNDGETFEYTIVELNNDTLILNYTPRGNTLKYHKGISPAEQEFLDSGRAKAILDETDLWPPDEDTEDSSSNPNYCKTTEDCLVVPNPSNGCYSGYFNKNATEAIKKFKDDRKMMIQDCPKFGEVYCKNNTCAADRL